jgi:alpha-L-rhamnosidase
VLHDISGMFTAYPFTQQASFAGDVEGIEAIWDINWRILRLSAFDHFMDTPYYEQLQYVGDTRLEALVSLYNSGDERLARNAVQLFDQSRLSEGLTASRYPSRVRQTIPPFSLWWVAMVHDYWMLRDEQEFVQSMVPGTRTVLDWFARHVDETGMVGPIPWWGFLDWNPQYVMGMAPGVKNSQSTAITLQYAYSLQRAAELEQELGLPALAAHYRQQADALIAATRAHAWDAERGLFADTPERESYSQHANALAVLTGAVPPEQQAELMARVLDDPDLLLATYYFRFYVDEAMREAGLADRYLERLEPWREMLAMGLTTTPENPEPTRSDSHAWAAHPNYHLLATVLGVRPGSAGFRTVEIAPALGELEQAEGTIPHPLGAIEVALERHADGGISSDITLPAGLAGSFVWYGQRVELEPGTQHVSLPAE